MPVPDGVVMPKGDALRPMIGGEPFELPGGLVERLVPADPLPLARSVLGAHAAERM